jgi:hypothetical protein
MRSAGEGYDGDEKTAAENADAAAGREMKFAPLAEFAGVNVQTSREAAGASGSMSGSVGRNPAGNLAINGGDFRPNSGPAQKAESQSGASKGKEHSSEAAKRDDSHGRAKADAQRNADSNSASTGISTGMSMGMMPLLIAQQQIQIPALAAGAGTGMQTAPVGEKTAGNTNSNAAFANGSSANTRSDRTVQPLKGIAPGGVASAAGDREAIATSDESVAEDCTHGLQTGDHLQGPREESLLVSGGAGDSEQKTALPGVAAQETQAAGAHTAESTTPAVGGDGTVNQSTSTAASASASDAGHESVSTPRPGRNSNAGPGVGQNSGQSAGEGSTALGHGGNLAIMPAVGIGGGTHGMPPNTAAAAPDSGAGTGSEKGAGETFAAMDAQANGSGITWVHSGTHQAEAGFQDPALGWVAVRAEMGAGGVHAAIVPGTAEAAQTLGGHMAGLSAHLAEQRVGVSAVSMNSPGNSPGIAPDFAGGGAGQNGGHYGAGQGQNQGQQQPVYAVPAVASSSGAGNAAQFNSGTQGGTQPAAVATGARGRHISVVA